MECQNMEETPRNRGRSKESGRQGWNSGKMHPEWVKPDGSGRGHSHGQHGWQGCQLCRAPRSNLLSYLLKFRLPFSALVQFRGAMWILTTTTDENVRS
jgi:hypothetical protein